MSQILLIVSCEVINMFLRAFCKLVVVRPISVQIQVQVLWLESSIGGHVLLSRVTTHLIVTLFIILGANDNHHVVTLFH